MAALAFPSRALPCAALVLVACAVHAQGPPVDTRQFPKLVRLLLLPEEQALLKQLKSDDERREFQRIFWARRDPTPGTAANELEEKVRAVWERADQLFAFPNQKGSETGCGQVLALLGRPEEVLGLETRVRFDDLQYLREGDRKPETWVYRDRPGRPFAFTRAELRIAFDPDCRFAEGGIVAEDLRRAAGTLVTRPEIAYTRGADGRLQPLARQTGGTAAAIDLLTAPRTDFPLAAEVHLVLRTAGGEALVAGLARLHPVPPGGRVSLAVRAVDGSGQAQSTGVRESALAPSPDGSGVASWSLSLRPGRHRVSVAAHLSDDGMGSVTSIDVEVPDFSGAALVTSPILAYADEPASGGPGDALDPYAAMQLGSMRLRPRFGNVFAPADALMVVAAVYGAKVDTATGRAALRTRFTVLKGIKPVARGAEDAFTTADAVASVGPIPLADYAPGAYVIRLEVTDEAGNQTLRRETPFEIRQP